MTTCQQIRASTIDKLHYHRHPYQSPRSSMIGIADILNKDSPPNDQTLTLSNTIEECESLDNNSTCSNPQKDSPEIPDRSISDEITTIEKPLLQTLTSVSDDITTHHLSIKSPTHVEIPPISSLTKLLSRQFNPPQGGIKAPGQSSSNNHLAYLPTRRITSSHYGGFIDKALESRKARSNSLQLLSLSPSLQLSLSISSPLIDSSNLVSTAASPTRSPKSRQSSFVREPSLLTVEVKDVELSTSVKRLLSKKPRIPKSRIHKKILASKKFVQLSIRRKNGTSHSTGDPGDISKHIENSKMGGNQISNYDANVGSLGSKLHFKSLEAGMKVKLTLSNSFVSLYNHLIPGVNKRQIYKLVGQSKNEGISCTYETVPAQSDSSVVSLPVQIIDSSLVNMADIPNKVLRSLANLPTFNSFNTAVNTLFGGVADYTLVRVTRSSATTNERSVLLKLETAKPGDFSLIDDDESAEEMLHSLGKTGDSPSNIFVKKIVARPRYKSKMKIYMIPVNQDCVLYTDERMFERDLYNGIVDLTDTNPDRKEIFVTFSVNHIIQEYNSLVKMSALESPLEQPVPGLPTAEPLTQVRNSPLPKHEIMSGAATLSLPPIQNIQRLGAYTNYFPPYQPTPATYTEPSSFRPSRHSNERFYSHIQQPNPPLIHYQYLQPHVPPQTLPSPMSTPQYPLQSPLQIAPIANQMKEGLPLPPQNFAQKHSWPMGYSTSTPGIINYTNYSSSTTSRISSKNSSGGSISS